MTRRRFRRSSRLRLGAVLTCGAVAGIGRLGGQQAAPPVSTAEASVMTALQAEVQQQLKKCHDAVVRIQAADEHGLLAGSGFFVDPNGLLYTTYSIAGESHDIVVLRGEQKFPARRLVADPRSGMALVKVDVQTPFLPIAKSHDLAVGSPVITCGYPMDLPLTPSFGLVGGFDRKYLGRYFATTHIRANVSVQRGEGGAPLLNMKGEVVGMLISSLDQGSASFALPIEAAEKVRRDFIRYGCVRPAWLGLQMETISQPIHGSTAQVQNLLPDGAAEKAGIKVGDIFLGIAQSKITCPEDMVDATFFLTAQDTVPVAVVRGDAELTVQMCPADPPKRPLLGPMEENPGRELLRLGGP